MGAVTSSTRTTLEDFPLPADLPTERGASSIALAQSSLELQPLGVVASRGSADAQRC